MSVVLLVISIASVRIPGALVKLESLDEANWRNVDELNSYILTGTVTQQRDEEKLTMSIVWRNKSQTPSVLKRADVDLWVAESPTFPKTFDFQPMKMIISDWQGKESPILTVAPGETVWLRLDSKDPAKVRDILKRIEPANSLFDKGSKHLAVTFECHLVGADETLERGLGMGSLDLKD